MTLAGSLTQSLMGSQGGSRRTCRRLCGYSSPNEMLRVACFPVGVRVLRRSTRRKQVAWKPR
ncbi:hypothetical protein [Dendronalium sp. ChiSLP03b]|uniref:hypothetical protein n=1 Tax=Dendronalium sp. ChiSLP03b TaxID=3075381 RepID=UPI002ADD02D0|nr:hypothetical protein [Dendronalium sp. ChiSLP03b]